MAEPTKKPTRKVTGMSIARNGYRYTGTWTVPNAATRGDEAFTEIYTKWTLDRTTGKDPIDKDKHGNENLATDTENINNFESTKGKTFTRSSWHPVKKNATLDKVVLTVWGKNNKGNGPKASAKYPFKLPRKPKISWSYNQSTGQVTATITTDAGADNYERYDTMYKITVIDGTGAEKVVQKWKADDATTITKTAQTSDYTADFGAGQTLDFKCWAYARGIHGDNPKKEKAVYAHRVIAMPRACSINKIKVSSKNTTGRISVYVTPGSYTSKVQLERRHGENGTWETVQGAEDDGSCSILYDSVGIADPVDGEYIYYRVVSTRDNFQVTGNAVRADELYTALPSSSASNVGIVSAIAGDDGKSAKVVVGWNEESAWTGTEITWSENPEAWESTESPNLFEATWKDATSRSQDWQKTMLINIMGLSEGKTTYIKARRYLEAEAGRVYSGYAESDPIVPVTRPESVSISAPPYVKRGEDILVTWSYSGGATQTEYHVHPYGDPNTAYAENEDSLGAAVITPEKYGDAESIRFYVSVGTGGELTDSLPATVGIRDAPTLSMTVPATCQANNSSNLYSFTLTCSEPARVICSCRLIGSDVTMQLPDNDYDQLVGDVVWTDGITPIWEVSGTNYTTTIQLPEDTTLYDTGQYEITAYAIDQETGLASETVSGNFKVNWSHQAPTPSSNIAITPNVEDASVQITLTAPSSYSQSDVYDVYRGTFDRYELIADNLKFGTVLVDKFAAFSDGGNSYAICTKTADGDTEWSEYPYTMQSDKMRIDWDDSYVELPWSNKRDNSYSKSFSRAEHLDGSFSGKWRRGVARDGNYSTIVIKSHDGDNMKLLAEMANYSGACYIRTPDGRAFACNIDPSYSGSDYSMLEEASFKVSALSLSPQFMPDPSDMTVP